MSETRTTPRIRARCVVFSDVAGDYDLLRATLERAGVLAPGGGRRTNARHRVTVFSIGDLINSYGDTEDERCLSEVGNWIDYLICGNHEYPYVNPLAELHDYVHDAGTQAQMDRIVSEGRLLPGHLFGETLVTHAGWDQDNHPLVTTAEQALAALNDAVKTTGWNHRYFSACGTTRGGEDAHGGVLWEDFSDLRSPFPQIVGHSAGTTVKVKHNAICIDTAWSGQPTSIELRSR